MEFPPAPQNASTIKSQRHLSAMCRAMRSGVTENHESREGRKGFGYRREILSNKSSKKYRNPIECLCQILKTVYSVEPSTFSTPCFQVFQAAAGPSGFHHLVAF